MRKNILLTGALFSGLLTCSANITPYAWFRFDTYKQPTLDATGQGHTMGGYTPGNAESPYCTQPVVGNIAVGGPLGPEGYFSSFAIRSSANGAQGCIFASAQSGGATRNSNAWGNFFQDNTNWVAEVWYLPTLVGGGGNNGATPIFSTCVPRSSAGWVNGAALMSINGTNRLTSNNGQNQNDGHVWVRLQTLCPPSVTDTNGNTMDYYVGPPVLVKTPTNASWMHFAIVRDTVAGTLAWYTNGVMVASTPLWRTYFTNAYVPVGFAGMQDSGYGNPGGGGGITGPDGNTHIGFDGAAQRLQGYTAEVRVSAFNPGEFSVTNLLTRRIAPGSPTVYDGPSVVSSPQNVTVWEGGGAPFVCVAATDTDVQYQWQRNSVNIPGATNRTYVLESATVAADNGKQFRCILAKGSLTATSAVATITVVPSNPGIVNGYSNAVLAESSLVAYFPVDGSTGTVLKNVKDPAYNGTVFNQPYAFWNGNTNIAAGKQSLSLNTPNAGYSGGFSLTTNTFGYVQIQGDNPGYTFSSGNGTIEAVLYMEPSVKQMLSSELPCWFSSGTVPNSFDYYNFSADINGNLYYQSSGASQLLWSVPGGLVGKRTHVAFVFSNTTNVTCYVNGVSLGKKYQAGFGNTPPDAYQPLSIGMRGGQAPDQIGYMPNAWRGSVDELAIYGSALSANTVASHYFTLLNGSAATPVSVAQISPSKSLYLGFPGQTLSVTAGGTPPFTYQWRSNNVTLAGEVTPILSVPTLPVGVYNYSVVLKGGVGNSITSAPVVLTVVAPTGYSAKVFASSGGAPKAFYPLNETSGTTVYDWAGTHDGQLFGVYSLGNDGPASTSSLRMFGTNILDPVTQLTTASRVEIPYYPELNPLSGAMTHEFWYRADNANRTICATSSQFNTGNNRAGLAVMEGPGTAGYGQSTIRYWDINCGRYNNINQGVAQGSGIQGVTPAANGQWQHIAVVMDGPNGTATLYVNGVPEFTTGCGYSLDPNAAYVWNQNLYAPLILGNYNGAGAYPMEGSLSQVAVYDYALTYEDITNHTALVWTPAFFTAQPAAVTNVENTTVTLTATASGVPNTYQWQKNGVDLTQAYNFDGTEHYPRVFTAAGDSQGVNSPRLVIAQTKTNDSGSYSLKVINPMNTDGFTNSAAAYVRITNDIVKPTATLALAKSTMVSGAVQDDLNNNFGIYWGPSPTPAPLFLVEVKFSKRVDPTTSVNPANYTLTGGVTVTNVVLANSVTDTKFQGAFQTVGLVTSGLTPNATYTLSVSNVQDQASFPNTMDGQTLTFKTPPLTTGRAVWDYYYQINGGYFGLATGPDSPYPTNTTYPYVPLATGAVTNFSSDAIGWNFSLNNNPVFTGQANNYASVITAWVTPTNTGWYEFFISADDQARLYLNPSGADPAGAGWIGDAAGGPVFDDLYALPYHYKLNKGLPYFIQAVHTQSTGSDFVRVGWRYLGTEDVPYDGTGINGAWIVAATNLPPIEGKFLSAYLVNAPVIAVQPQSIVASAGTTNNLFVVVASTGTGVTNYQWKLNGVNQAGKIAATNSFEPLAFGNYGNWMVAVDDGGVISPTLSSVATVLPPTFVITNLPVNAVAPLGVPHNLTVTSSASSGQTGYQWRFNGVNLVRSAYIANPTSQTMTINTMRTPDNVGAYDVIVNDGFHYLTSNVQSLTIASQPNLSSSVSGSTFSLAIPSQVGPQYVVEWKGALTNGVWNQLLTTNGTGGQITVPISTLPSRQQFLRVRMQ